MSVGLFAIFFSHSEDCLFIWFIVYFAVQKLLNLIRSHSFIFIFITLEDGSKKVLLQLMSKSILFTCKSFIVSDLRFRSLIYFELILVYGVKESSNFMLLHVALHVQFTQHHLLKRLSLIHYIFSHPLS